MNLLTRREVADKLKISQRTVDKILRNSDFEGVVRIGRRVLVNENYLEAWLKQKIDM